MGVSRALSDFRAGIPLPANLSVASADALPLTQRRLAELVDGERYNSLPRHWAGTPRERVRVESASQDSCSHCLTAPPIAAIGYNPPSQSFIPLVRRLLGLPRLPSRIGSAPRFPKCKNPSDTWGGCAMHYGEEGHVTSRHDRLPDCVFLSLQATYMAPRLEMGFNETRERPGDVLYQLGLMGGRLRLTSP